MNAGLWLTTLHVKVSLNEHILPVAGTPARRELQLVRCNTISVRFYVNDGGLEGDPFPL
jgi:hypothetical protein